MKVIIIGATSGIGKELALQMAADGHQIGITGRRTEKLAAIKSTAPDQFYMSSWDASDLESNELKINELVTQLGGLDLLVINSGVGQGGHRLKYEREKLMTDLMVSGFSQIAVWGWNYFAQQGKGHLVNISSIAALRAHRYAPGYNASKAFQASYLEALRQKAVKQKLDIAVTDIRPGFVETPMTDGQKGMFWVAPVEKATRQIYSAIKRKRKVAYITKRWRLIAILFKILPRGIYQYF